MYRVLKQLSQLQQQLLQPVPSAEQFRVATALAAQADRLSICFVIATVQVEAAAQLLQVGPPGWCRFGYNMCRQQHLAC